MTFCSWLSKQTKRGDEVGYFADDTFGWLDRIGQSGSMINNRSKEELGELLGMYKYGPEVRGVFDRVWAEYQDCISSL